MFFKYSSYIMETYNIVKGVLKKESKHLFTSKIEKEFEGIKSEIDRIENEIQKYDRIIAVLDRLPMELGWSLPFLPVTQHALLPSAMLTNTNEIQVHIGDGWFTRCSAHHAKGICHRRQEKCRETKKALKERGDLLQEWLRVAIGQQGISGGHEDQAEEDEEMVGPADVFNANEITEFVSEEEYLAEKAAHKERARAHYLKQRAIVKSQQEIENEELWNRLEELEMEEYSHGELQQTDERQNKSKIVEQHLEQELADDAPTINAETIKLGWTWDDGSESEDSSSSEEEEEIKDRPRKLSFADHIKTGSDETCVIEFSHTPVESVKSPVKPTPGTLQSPTDIYTAFHELFSPANTKPKIAYEMSVKRKWFNQVCLMYHRPSQRRSVNLSLPEWPLK
ncbi:hypothetical protein B566_EDAN014741 [Ephemera danica]|nr:hypothetical protein B566_EDAN014741 [Ephemera danica]